RSAETIDERTRIDLARSQHRRLEGRLVRCVGESLRFQGDTLWQVRMLSRQALAPVELRTWLVALQAQHDAGAVRAQFRDSVCRRAQCEAMIVAAGQY